MATICCKDVIFQNIEAVIFDKDGTLANSETFLRTLGQRRSRLIDAQIPGVQDPLLMAFGLDSDKINPAGLLAVGTRRENEIAAAAYVAETGRDWLDALAMVHSAFVEADKTMQRKAVQTPLIQESLDLLQALAAVNLKLGILSSDTTENVEDFVQTYGLGSYFQFQMGTDEGPVKPDPGLLERACARLQVRPETTLLIGDSQADIQLARAAIAAGCIAVTWGWTSPFNLANADAIVSQATQIQVSV